MAYDFTLDILKKYLADRQYSEFLTLEDVYLNPDLNLIRLV